MPVSTSVPADASIIDVTGQASVIIQVSAAPVSPTPAATPAVPPAYPVYDYAPPKLGKIYGQQLGLTAQQISWLNKFWCPDNVFLAIEGARQATVLLYVAVLKELERQFKAEGSTLAQEVKALDAQAQQAYRQAYSWYSGGSYTSAGEQAGADVYLTIFKQCENAVREQFGHKRKISSQFSAQLTSLDQAYQQRFGNRVQALLPELAPRIPGPDAATELDLNAQNTTRWKTAFDQLAAQLPHDTAGFAAGVYRLGELNAHNPAVENIFFEASRTLARHDPEESLRLYLHYLHHDFQSATINNKQLAKTIQKSLFAQPEHLERFEAIVQQFTQEKDLARALEQVPQVYARQRRKIQLDMGAVQTVRQQHSGTVERLNEYLRDEPEALTPPPADPVPVGLPSADSSEIQLTVAAPATTGRFNSTVALTATQQDLLLLFADAALTLPQAQVEAFARDRGALRNQLIDSINDGCYELLDDVLIEESGDDYTIYEPYFQQLTTPC
ncbi:tellurite resistance TerB C-terminal domain-containing protein [Hymenobacter sp. CRA2]|uniref:tellurite resistance TerB C-terminal domain-containing protein n=1 Tax=Hymenobacter sp. CRA2 TaxID=1955620 RepID=UPI00098E9D02|nr:tellurite resistance TerB C-terminal domain-containing protein [Hymenobacter sp. CRA2]OON66251.1 hypothetical protein B0919_22460 [Hymenobacter sp. CRA2]